jgi:hypothetical protein
MVAMVVNGGVVYARISSRKCATRRRAPLLGDEAGEFS